MGFADAMQVVEEYVHVVVLFGDPVLITSGKDWAFLEKAYCLALWERAGSAIQDKWAQGTHCGPEKTQKCEFCRQFGPKYQISSNSKIHYVI
jgi:hypothetical protein